MNGGADGVFAHAKSRGRAGVARRQTNTIGGRGARVFFFCSTSPTQLPPPPPPLAKDAHRDLANFLASATTLAALDAATLDAHPAEKVPPDSWPALASATVAGLREDLKAAIASGDARRRPPDPDPMRALKGLVTTASAPGRWPGVESPLATRAAGLMAFVADALAAYAPPGPAVDPGSIGAELVGLLRSAVLASPALCVAVPAAAWGGLVEAWAAPALAGRDPAGAAAVLTGVLRRNPGGLTGKARAKAGSGLDRAFTSASDGRADARTCASLLMAGAVFLARHGLDMGRPGCARLVEAGAGLLASAWGAAGRGDGRARDASVAFVRAALAVGGLDGGGVAAARAAVAAEISRPGFEWADRGAAAAAAAAAAPAVPLPPHPRLPGPPLITATPPLHVGPLALARPAGALLALAAALEDAATAADPAAWGLEAGAGGADAAAVPSPPRAAKRARTAPAVPSLPDRLAAYPGRWAPVVCALLRLRGRPPIAVARALLAALAAPLAGGRGLCPPTAPASAGRHPAAAARTADAIAATWVLRATADLAAYWPGKGSNSGVEDEEEEEVEEEEAGGAAAPPTPPAWAALAGVRDTTAGDASDGDDGDPDADWGGWRGRGAAAGDPATHWAALVALAGAWFAAPGAPAAPADAAALALAAAARAGLLPTAALAPLPCRLLVCPPLVTPVPSAAALTLVAALGTPDLSAGGPRCGGGGGGGSGAARPRPHPPRPTRPPARPCWPASCRRPPVPPIPTWWRRQPWPSWTAPERPAPRSATRPPTGGGGRRRPPRLPGRPVRAWSPSPPATAPGARPPTRRPPGRPPSGRPPRTSPKPRMRRATSWSGPSPPRR